MKKDKYEIEYSFICTNPESLEKLRSDLYCTKIHDLADLYFDTPDELLSKNKFVFRQRIENGQMMYTLKGPTSYNTTGTNPPKRLELETDDMNDMISEITKRIPEAGVRSLNIIQERYTKREEYEFPSSGFIMYIDYTKFDNGARYTNIEVEGTNIKNMNEFKLQLLRMNGFREWKPSKFAVGKAVRALYMYDRVLSTEDLHKIEIYLDNKKKND